MRVLILLVLIFIVSVAVEGTVLAQELETNTLTTVRFQLMNDGAEVLDRETHLVWERVPDPTLRNLQEGMSYCRSKGRGWRLPTISELEDLSHTRIMNIIEIVHSGDPCWTGTTSAWDIENQWAKHFNRKDAILMPIDKRTNISWCVHDDRYTQPFSQPFQQPFSVHQ